MPYRTKDSFDLACGFDVTPTNIIDAIQSTNSILSSLSTTLYKSIDYKTTSSIVGALLCDNIASVTEGIVNPIEKGHPDIVPLLALNASEEELRNYPSGLEIKCTIGNIQKGANLRAGVPRINSLVGITWQAHHREVEKLLGIIWDFVIDNPTDTFHFPKITGIFYASNLEENDWGQISGLTGRNTKVTGMKASGRIKMGNGWLALLNQNDYSSKYQQLLGFEA